MLSFYGRQKQSFLKELPGLNIMNATLFFNNFNSKQYKR